MKQGDVILSFDGREVTDTRELVRVVGNTKVGKTVRVVVFRDDGTTTLKVTLGRREEAEAAAIPAAQPSEPVQDSVMGLTLSTLTEDLRRQLELGDRANGLVVMDVDPASQAYEKGLRAGDLITEAGQQTLMTIMDFENRIEAAREAGRKSLLLLVRRGGEPRFVALSVAE
jgi:serine protease Do